MYVWGVDRELDAADEQPRDERDPTQELLITESTGVAPGSSREELPVVEHAPRDV
jgi:hypothetical protein